MDLLSPRGELSRDCRHFDGSKKKTCKLLKFKCIPITHACFLADLTELEAKNLGR